MTRRAVKPGSRRCAVQGGAWERRNCVRRKRRQAQAEQPRRGEVVARRHRRHGPHIRPHLQQTPGCTLTWEWQRKPKPSMVTAGSRMVPNTSASSRRLKAATSRF